MGIMDRYSMTPVEHMTAALDRAVQGYVAHKKQPPSP